MSENDTKLSYEFLDSIHVNLHSRLKIEDIAHTFHVSRDYLSQAFKKKYNITPAVFVASL